jgi:hypothetical protein
LEILAGSAGPFLTIIILTSAFIIRLHPSSFIFNMTRLIPFLALLALLALTPRPSSAETTLGSAITRVPINITVPGVYHFTKDLVFTPIAGVAINIAASGVVIDLNGYQLATTTGPGNASTAIFCNNVNRVTVKDGDILGFENGVILFSSGATVKDLFVNTSYKTGIELTGDNNEIIHNRIASTGGSTLASGTAAVGIVLSGSYGTVTDNDIQNTFTPDTAGRSATGILLHDCSNVVASSNRVLGVTPTTPVNASATGIAIPTSAPSSNVILIGNIVTDTQLGFDLSGGTSGSYGDNTTSGNTNNYNTSGTGITNIGNNN